MANPSVTSVRPSEVAIGYTGIIRVRGVAFKADTLIFFGTDAAAVVELVGTSEIKVKLDFRITGRAGARRVWASDPNQHSGSADDGVDFRVGSP